MAATVVVAPRVAFVAAFLVALVFAWLVVPGWALVFPVPALVVFWLLPPGVPSYTLRRMKQPAAGASAAWIAALLVPVWLNPETVRLTRYLRDVEDVGWFELFLPLGQVPVFVLMDLDAVERVVLLLGVLALPWLVHVAAQRPPLTQGLLAVMVTIAVAWPLAMGMAAVTEDGARDADGDSVADADQPVAALPTWLAAFLGGILVLAVGLVTERRLTQPRHTMLEP